jgi:hypothetical protein
MKRLIFVFTLVLLTASLASAQQNEAQQKEAVFAVVGESTHDFGTIKEADGPVSHIFKFKNEGEIPLVITKATASCGCTQPEYPKEPVAPGKTGEIKVTFNPSGNAPFTKTISIFSNGKVGSSVLTIKGVVEGKQ